MKITDRTIHLGLREPAYAQFPDLKSRSRFYLRMPPVRRFVMLVAAWVVIACSMTGSQPAAVDTSHDACSYCRMVVSDQRFAAQIIAPSEEPKFFDDLSCLRNYLATTTPPARARVFVADHRTKAWVPAERAVYTRVEAVTAPMGGHVIAHESAESRGADPDAALGTPADANAIFGDRLPTGGQP